MVIGFWSCLSAPEVRTINPELDVPPLTPPNALIFLAYVLAALASIVLGTPYNDFNTH